MSSPSESVILCEGYRDRAFWKGWLEHLGCTDARPRGESGRYGTAVDPFGKSVGRGHFAFYTPNRTFVRVNPCGGDLGVKRELRIRLEQRKTQALRCVIVSLDLDASVCLRSDVADDRDDYAQRAAGLRQGMRDIVIGADPKYKTSEDEDLSIDHGKTMISLVLWSTEDPSTAHLPAKQTLERLVCAALCSAYPDRGAAVAAWLAARQDAPYAGPKEHAWSHMAGWYGNQGCDEFYQCIWSDSAVVAELCRRLEKSGAWRSVAHLLAG